MVVAHIGPGWEVALVDAVDSWGKRGWWTLWTLGAVDGKLGGGPPNLVDRGWRVGRGNDPQPRTRRKEPETR